MSTSADPETPITEAASEKPKRGRPTKYGESSHGTMVMEHATGALSRLFNGPGYVTLRQGRDRAAAMRMHRLLLSHGCGDSYPWLVSDTQPKAYRVSVLAALWRLFGCGATEADVLRYAELVGTGGLNVKRTVRLLRDVAAGRL